MLQERREKIVEMLNADKIVKVNELVQIFGVSIETIRRDLEYLEQQGFLNRVYGGALPAQRKALEPTYMTREIAHYEEKKRIGRRAAELVRDGEVLAIDIGTTTLEFAKALVGNKKVTVITNSMKIAMVLSEDRDIEVIMLGGSVRSGEFSVSGSLANQNTGLFNTDKLFLGVGGLTIEKGITDYHAEESNLRRHTIQNTQKVIALADYSKFGIVAMNKVCDLTRVDVLVTDDKVSGDIVKQLMDMELEVILV